MREFLRQRADRCLGISEKGSGYRQLPPGFRGRRIFCRGWLLTSFRDVLVVQSLWRLALYRMKDTVVKLLREILEEDGVVIRGVYERSDAKVRRQEGMELCKGFIGEPFDTDVEIEENGVRYLVDVKGRAEDGIFPGSEI